MAGRGGGSDVGRGSRDPEAGAVLGPRSGASERPFSRPQPTVGAGLPRHSPSVSAPGDLLGPRPPHSLALPPALSCARWQGTPGVHFLPLTPDPRRSPLPRGGLAGPKPPPRPCSLAPRGEGRRILGPGPLLRGFVTMAAPLPRPCHTSPPGSWTLTHAVPRDRHRSPEADSPAWSHGGDAELRWVT